MIQVSAAMSEEHEAESVMMKLQAHKFENRTKFLDYAILYRGNHQARIFEQHLRNQRSLTPSLAGNRFLIKPRLKTW